MSNASFPLFASDPSLVLLDRQEVLRLLGGISTSTLYLGMQRGVYPRPIRVGQRAVRWRYSDILPIVRNGLPQQ